MLTVTGRKWCLASSQQPCKVATVGTRVELNTPCEPGHQMVGLRLCAAHGAHLGIRDARGTFGKQQGRLMRP